MSEQNPVLPGAAVESAWQAHLAMPDPELQRALNHAIDGDLRPVALGLGILQVVLGLAPLILDPGGRGSQVLLDVTIGALLIALGLLLPRLRPRGAGARDRLRDRGYRPGRRAPPDVDHQRNRSDDVGHNRDHRRGHVHPGATMVISRSSDLPGPGGWQSSPPRRRRQNSLTSSSR